MSIVSVKQAVRFTPYRHRNEDGTPRDGAPVYLIMPPSVMSKARWRRHVAEEGAVMPGQDLLMETLRQGVLEIVEERQQPRWFDLIARWDDALRTSQEMRESGAGTPEQMEDAAAALRKLSTEVSYFEGQMRAAYPPYAQKLAQQQYWMEVAPFIAARHFLAGWENVDLPFERVNGLVSEELLEQLSEGHAADIGWRAIGLGGANRADEKNSDGASASGANPKRSGRARKARGTASVKNSTTTRH